MRMIVFLMVSTAIAGPLQAAEIENGTRPQGGSYTLEFVEDLRFGADEDEDEYIWAFPSTTISADSKGHIYIADPREQRILEFDTAGKFLKLVAKKGQGPGELQSMLNFTVLKDDTGIAVDLEGGVVTKFKKYGKDMAYVSETASQGTSFLLQAVNLSPLGDLFGATFVNLDISSGKMSIKTGLVSSELKVLKETSSSDRPLPDPSRFGDPNYWSDFIGGNLKAIGQSLGVFAFDNEGNIYCAQTDTYKISKFSSDLKTEKMSFSRKYKPIANNEAHLTAIADRLSEQFQAVPQLQGILTKSVLRKAIELSEPPLVKQPIFGMVIMESGEILVIHDVQMDTGINLADIFSKEGKFIGQVSMKNHGIATLASGALSVKMSFRNGYAYTIETDEMGENRAVRYKYNLVKTK